MMKMCTLMKRVASAQDLRFNTLLLRLHLKHENLTHESPACESWENVERQLRQLLSELWTTFGRHACKGKRRFIKWGEYECDDESDSETEFKCGCDITFFLYINDIANSSEKLSFKLFASDTNIFISSKDPRELERTINAELIKVKKKWTGVM